jgi:putative heme degradation protein
LHLALQVDEEANVLKVGWLITYVQCVAENEISKHWLFCKPIDGRATSLEVFSLIDGFLGKNE